ncbi:hypothetical protein [Lederbergia ruris]|uniref:hypothetical protein n=1 Tax=Lederbergia ruris TaxID=217495 RepID=UPI0039A06C7C
MTSYNYCSRCKSNPCSCSIDNGNENKIENNPTNTNTFNPTINIITSPKEERKKRKEKCECSGHLDFQLPVPDGVLNINAEICPSCTIQGSFVSLDAPDLTLNSTSVNFPQCRRIVDGTTLSTTGFGTFIFNNFVFQGTFELNLLETNTGDDFFLLLFSGFDQMGISGFFFFTLPVPDNALSITSCTSCHNVPTAANQRSKNQELMKTANKGKMIYMVNGQLEQREL